MLAIRSGQCYQLELPDNERVKLLLEDYDFFVKDPALFSKRLDALLAIRGKQMVETWQAQIQNNQIDIVVQELLKQHYDPTYFASMKRNFARIGSAQTLQAQSRTYECLELLAKEIIAS
jgi:tRNA 2-selenouridine synthase